MPAAVAIPLIIGAVSAGSQVAGSVISAKAAKKAAALQGAAGDKALAAETQQYNEAKARSQPYVDAGNQALGNLTSLIGGRAPSGGGGLLNPYARTFNPALPGGGSLGPSGPPAAPMGRQMPQGMPPGTQAPPSGPMGQQGGMVTLRAPNGEQRSVPASQVDYFLSKGAQRVA